MTCSSHSDRRGDSGLLVGQVCRSGQLCRAKTCWHGDAGPWKVLDSVAAGRAELLSGTGVGFASSCFFTDMLNASNSQGPRSAQRAWPHTAHLHTHKHTVYTHSYTGTHKQTPKHFLQSAWLCQDNKIQQTQMYSHTHLCFFILPYSYHYYFTHAQTFSFVCLFTSLPLAYTCCEFFPSQRLCRTLNVQYVVTPFSEGNCVSSVSSVILAFSLIYYLIYYKSSYLCISQRLCMY